MSSNSSSNVGPALPQPTFTGPLSELVRSHLRTGIPLYKRIEVYEAFLVKAIDLLPTKDIVLRFHLDLNNLKVFDESAEDSDGQSDAIEAYHNDPFDPNDLHDLESSMLNTMERIEWGRRTVLEMMG